MDQTIKIQSAQVYSKSLIDIIHLKYSQFIKMIEELNGIAQYFVHDDGSSLSFNIVKGTDSTFLWKLTVRIECSKVKN